MEIDLSGAELERVAELVQDMRTAKGWSKEQAAREAGISSITWKRVEDALRVQDAKLAQVFRVLGIRGIGDPSGSVMATDDYSGLHLAPPPSPSPLTPEGRSLLEKRIADAAQRATELRAQLATAERELNSLLKVLVQVDEAVGETGPNHAAAAKTGDIEPHGEFD